jgi:hypothetical protein
MEVVDKFIPLEKTEFNMNYAHSISGYLQSFMSL